jgi:PmbA protein
MLAPATADLFDQRPLIERAERLVKAARAAGADAADAVAMRSLSLGIEVRDGAVEESESAEGNDLGLRVLVGKRQAVVSTNDMAGDAAELSARAVAMARAAPEDEFAGLAPDKLLAHDLADLDLIDRALPSVQDLEEMARRAEAAALAVSGVTKSGGANASAGIGGMVLVTSTGFSGAYLGSQHGVSVTAIAGTGTGMERDYDYSSALHAEDLESPETIGRRAGERSVARLNPRKVSTQKAPVVFDPRAAGSLVSHLASAANGAAVARKTSFLRDKMGQKLFADGISIIDDPLRKRGLRSHPFDGEGVACRKLALVEDGILQSWLLDCATARELGLVTTGHASRGVSSVPSPAQTNLHLAAGTISPDDLICDIKNGFYITDMIGMGVNMVTGDYSRGASGFWIENGKRSYPVSEVTIAGHLLDMFRSLTPADNLEFRYGTNAPTVRLEGLTIAGQ